MVADSFHFQRPSYGVKIGGSILEGEDPYDHVAEVIDAALRENNVRQLLVVVSGRKINGIRETDRTIEALAQQEAERTALPYGSLFPELDAALRNPMYGTTRFNRPDVAQTLVEPENYSVRGTVGALRARGVDDVVGYELRAGYPFPLRGIDDRRFLYATPDVEASSRQWYLPDARVIVLAGFGVLSPKGEVMCTGRGSSDDSLAQIAAASHGRIQPVLWKNPGGIYDPEDSEQRLLPYISREILRANPKKYGQVVNPRVLEIFDGEIVVAAEGKLTGTRIGAESSYATAQHLYEAAAAK